MKNKEVEEIINLSTSFIRKCINKEIDNNIAQAAFSNAWIRVCLSMGTVPAEFYGMTISAFNEYLKCYNEFYGKE